MDQDKFDKLPKYARDEINRLREQVASLTAQNEWLEDENRHKVEASNTILSEGLKNNTALPNFAQVEFHIETGEKRWKSAITVHVNRKGKSVTVMGSDSIVVSPQSSNYVEISLREM